MVNIPYLSNSSLYHETKEASKNKSTDLNLMVISPSLEPHGTVRSTRRTRIVGVALELYFSKISLMPVRFKIDFVSFVRCGQAKKVICIRKTKVEVDVPKYVQERCKLD